MSYRIKMKDWTRFNLLIERTCKVHYYMSCGEWFRLAVPGGKPLRVIDPINWSK